MGNHKDSMGNKSISFLETPNNSGQFQRNAPCRITMFTVKLYFKQEQMKNVSNKKIALKPSIDFF